MKTANCSDKNIILTGLPGCGKTTVGKILAEKLNLKFIDLDFLIEENEKMKISDIFEKKRRKIF